MKDYIFVKNLKMTAANLQTVKFQPLSSMARQILRRSNVDYKSAVLDSDKKTYQQAAFGLAKDYFQVKKAKRTPTRSRRFALRST